MAAVPCAGIRHRVGTAIHSRYDNDESCRGRQVCTGIHDKTVAGWMSASHAMDCHAMHCNESSDGMAYRFVLA